MPQLAALGGAPVFPEGHTWPTWPRVTPRHEEIVLDVLRGGSWFWGSANNEFAEKFAAFVGARYAVPAANGTVTLELALKALGLGPGDEVIVPALTWCATGQAPLEAPSPSSPGVIKPVGSDGYTHIIMPMHTAH